MTREEQLKVWEGEVLALLERVRDGQAVVGRSEPLRFLVMTLETSVDWLRIEQGKPGLRAPVPIPAGDEERVRALWPKSENPVVIYEPTPETEFVEGLHNPRYFEKKPES